MRFLTQFQSFDWARFAEKKLFISTGQRPWTDFETGASLGTIVDAVIYKDETPYRRKEGDTTTNRFEKVSFKISKSIDVPEEVQVRPVNVVANIWGEYRNNLSVKAEDIEVIQPRQSKAS